MSRIEDELDPQFVKQLNCMEEDMAAMQEEIVSLRAELDAKWEKQRWIPVSERLPDEWKIVVARKGEEKYLARYYHRINKTKAAADNYGWYKYLNQRDGVMTTRLGPNWATHWYELPEPPEEQQP